MPASNTHCFSRTKPSLPLPEKVRNRLNNGEAGRCIHDAVVSGDVDTVTQMLRSDPRLLTTHAVLAANERPFDGNSGDLLSFAVAQCDANMVAALLELGAKPDAITPGLPLSYAVLADNLVMARMLLQAGAAPDGHAPGTTTALDEALAFKSPEAVELLIQSGADVNRADAIGNTPLSKALTFSDYKSAQLLLRHGANPWQVANKGTVPAALLNEPAGPGGDEALRQKLLQTVKQGAPTWPPPSAEVIRQRFLDGTWPTSDMTKAGFVATPQAMESMRRTQAAAH